MSATAERFTPEWWQEIQHRHDEGATPSGSSEAGSGHDEPASPGTGPQHGAPEQGPSPDTTAANEHGFGIDEDNHGWAPDHGPSGSEDKEAGRKAWEAHDTQDAAHRDGDSDPGPDDPRLPSDQAGESMTARGEDIADRDGPEKGRHDTGPRGKSKRPTGTSTADDSTSVDPQDPIDPDSPNLRPA
jgi:hypothetical protein